MPALRILRGFTLAGLASVMCSALVCAQVDSSGEMETIHLVVDKGAPMWLALAKPLPAKHPGESVDARMMEPIHAFDRVVVPA